MVRSAEEAASVLATSISPEQCIKVLCPIIQTADYPINLAAIKMQTKVIERVSKETLNLLLPEIMPGLIQVGSKLGERSSVDTLGFSYFRYLARQHQCHDQAFLLLWVFRAKDPIASGCVCVCVCRGGWLVYTQHKTYCLVW